MITSPQQLSLVLHDWSYLQSHRDKLFKFCQELLKGLDDLRQELEDADEVVWDEQESQPIIKIKIPGPKQKVHDREPTGAQPKKKQCMR